MTDIQVEYAKHLEDQRHNYETEQNARDTLSETIRNNDAKIIQAQNELAQKAANDQGRLQLAMAELAEKIRLNDANILNDKSLLQLKRDELAELIRSHLANEKIAMTDQELRAQIAEANRLADMFINLQKIQAENDRAKMQAETQVYIANINDARERLKIMLDNAQKDEDQAMTNYWKQVDADLKQVDQLLTYYKTTGELSNEQLKTWVNLIVDLKELEIKEKTAMSKIGLSDWSGLMYMMLGKSWNPEYDPTKSDFGSMGWKAAMDSLIANRSISPGNPYVAGANKSDTAAMTGTHNQTTAKPGDKNPSNPGSTKKPKKPTKKPKPTQTTKPKKPGGKKK